MANLFATRSGARERLRFALVIVLPLVFATAARAEESVGGAARSFGRAVRDAGKAIGQGAKQVGRQTKGPAKEVGHGFRDGAVAVGHGFRDGFGKSAKGGSSARRARSKGTKQSALPPAQGQSAASTTGAKQAGPPRQSAAQAAKD